MIRGLVEQEINRYRNEKLCTNMKHLYNCKAENKVMHVDMYLCTYLYTMYINTV